MRGTYNTELAAAAIAGGLVTGLAMTYLNRRYEARANQGEKQPVAASQRADKPGDVGKGKEADPGEKVRPVLNRFRSAPGLLESEKDHVLKTMAWEKKHIARLRRASAILSPRDQQGENQLQAYLAGFTSERAQKRCMKSLFKQSVRRVQAVNKLNRMKRFMREREEEQNITLCRVAALSEEHDKKLQSLASQFVVWDFDIWELGSLTEKPLAVVGFQLICCKLELHSTFGIDRRVLLAYLRAVEAHYKPNPYHNALHGADAALALYYMLTTGELKTVAKLSDLQVLAALIAALCHDLGHEGVNNQYLAAVRHPHAITYNDASINENMHIATAFRLLQAPDTAVFSTLTDEQFRSARSLMIDMVLATDMAEHTRHLTELQDAVEQGKEPKEGGGGGKPYVWSDPGGQELLLSVALHCSDISNCAKPWKTYSKWTEAIMEEFFTQGEKERAKKLEISPGGYKSYFREKPPKDYNMQLGFIQFVIQPLFETVGRVPGMKLASVLAQLQENASTWEQKKAEAEAAEVGVAGPAAEGGAQ